MERFFFFPCSIIYSLRNRVSGKTKLFMNMGWIYRRVHSRTTPCDSHWNRGGRWRGTVSILTKTFRCWARATKAVATKGPEQPQYGDQGSQEPHGHSTELAHSRSTLQSPRCLGRANGSGQQLQEPQPGSELPSPCAQLSLITAKLGTHSCWDRPEVRP